jgi:hypothetical protein
MSTNLVVCTVVIMLAAVTFPFWCNTETEEEEIDDVWTIFVVVTVNFCGKGQI